MVQGEEISLPGKLCEKVNSDLLLNCNNVNKYEIYISLRYSNERNCFGVNEMEI